MCYENVTWDGNIKKQNRTIYNCKHCIAVDLILKHNQKDTMLGRVKIYLFIQLTWSDSWRHMKSCHGRLHYDRKFQIFIFLIGHINVNKGVFYRIKHCFVRTLSMYYCDQLWVSCRSLFIHNFLNTQCLILIILILGHRVCFRR